MPYMFVLLRTVRLDTLLADRTGTTQIQSHKTPRRQLPADSDFALRQRHTRSCLTETSVSETLVPIEAFHSRSLSRSLCVSAAIGEHPRV